MRCRRQKRTANHTRPERVIPPDIPCEIEDPELSVRLRYPHDLGPPTRNAVQQDDGSSDGPREVDDELNDISPDDRRHSAEERIDDGGDAHRQHREHKDRCRGIADADRRGESVGCPRFCEKQRGEHETGCVEPESIGETSGEQE